MQERLNRIWYDDARRPAAWLRTSAWLYGAVIHWRTRAYELRWLHSTRVAKPVVVVGNLTVGGTGKTPLVAWLAQELTRRNYRVGIVSRGYGRAYDTPHLVGSNSHWSEVGDEPLLLRQRTGCLTMVGRDRVAAAQALVGHGVDVIIADDGLQHLALTRDCEIVVVDGSRGFGNGSLLPAGPLREPASRLLRADITVVNGAATHQSLRGAEHTLAGRALHMNTLFADAQKIDGTNEVRSLERFRGHKLHAVAGIANPARFFRELRARGLDLIEHAFADHHPFTPPDLAFGDGLAVLMTEKDAVKCRQFGDGRLWYVPIAAHFDELQARQLLHGVLHKSGLATAGN